VEPDGFQRYEYGKVPPEEITTPCPSQVPEHDVPSPLAERVMGGGWVIETVIVFEHPSKVVMVIV
jgi:hypothetical protein